MTRIDTLTANQIPKEITDAIASLKLSDSPKYQSITFTVADEPAKPITKPSTINQFELLVNDQLHSAVRKQQASNIESDIHKELTTIPYETIKHDYANLMLAMHNVAVNPDNANATTTVIESVSKIKQNLNLVQQHINDIKDEVTTELDVTKSEISLIETKLQDIAKTGTTTRDEIINLKMNLLSATGNIETYKKVLARILPPVELAFHSTVDSIKKNVAAVSNQDLFSDSEIDFSKFSNMRTGSPWKYIPAQSDDSVPQRVNHIAIKQYQTIQNM